MRLTDFGMDTITLAGPLEAKLRAMQAAGFTQVMLSARDVVGHPEGEATAIARVRASGLRVTGFQVLRDFEGLSGHLHDYKVDIAKSMLQLGHALGAPLLLVCSSTSTHATGELEAVVADLRKLAMLAVPLGMRVAYEALSWGRHAHQLAQAWAVVERAKHANLGLCVDSFHALANEGAVDTLDMIDPAKVFLVQLSDFLWQQIRSREERMETARHLRVFPGEGVHNDLVAELVRRLERRGYAGDYSFEVFNDDYAQMPLASVWSAPCARCTGSPVGWRDVASRCCARSAPDRARASRNTEVGYSVLHDLGRPGARIDARVPFLDLAVPVDHHADPLPPLGGIDVGAVGGADGAVGVADQREVEVELLGKGFLFSAGVSNDAPRMTASSDRTGP